MSNIVNLAFITDKNYLMPTYIAILSAKLSKNKDSVYNVYLIISNSEFPDLQLFKNIEDENFKIFPILKEKMDIQDLSNQYIYHFAPSIFIKLELEKILGDCHKVLFLDCDIIVKHDLTEVYNTNLDNYYIGGCLDAFVPVYHLKNHNIKYENYFNTGVMLLNLDLIRQDNFFEKAKKYYIECGNNFEYPEQDALNNIIGKKLKVLSPIYNWTVWSCRYSKKQLKKYFKLDNVSEIDEDNIVIIHYAAVKPWLYTNVYYHKYWEDIYNQSELKDVPLIRKNKFHIFAQIYMKLRTMYRLWRDRKYYKEIGIL